MLRVFACLTQDHDHSLVALAALVCAVASITAFSLLAHAVSARGRIRALWLAATALVTGGGIWATHFIAMLAFDPRMAVGYDVVETLLSVVIAIAVSGIGFAVAAERPLGNTVSIWVGGAVAGLGIAAMHYTGMRALIVPATIAYDPALVAASVAFGALFAALAMWRFRPEGGLRSCLESGGLLVLGICLMHFTGMGAATFVQAPLLVIDDDTLPVQWLAIAIAAAVLVIAAVAMVASVVGQRVAFRSRLEAERLRATVAELERTKGQLEATSANLQTALEAAAAGSQAKSQFLAAMSHELRTPLNAVIGFSEVMSAEIYGQLTERQRGCVDDIRRAGTHLLGLVNDVLDVSRLEANAVQLDEEQLDLCLVIDEAIALNAVRAEEMGIRVGKDLPPAMPTIRADQRRVRQILVNLLSNAVKFTPAGGEVSVAVRHVAAGLEIAVRDTGIGMAPDEIPIALQRFGQVDSRLARKFEGTGLGLPLTKRLVELHGGTLAIQSRQNHGTTVTVLFPATRLVDERAAA